MEDKKLSTGVPRRSLIYLLICVAGIMAFVLVGIYPSYRNLARTDGSIAELKARIEEQKILFPLYQKLRKELAAEASRGQPGPSKVGLPVRRVDDLTPIFGEIAANCGMELSAVTPDVKSLVDDSRFLSVGVALRGNFTNLRNFLVALSNLPYLGDIEQLQIQEGPSGKEYFLKLWLMIDNPRPGTG